MRIRTDLVFESDPGFLFFTALALAVLFLVLQYRRLSADAPRAAALFLMGTRTLLLAVFAAFLLKPTILRQRLAQLRAKQPVLIDVSRSMSLPYGGGESRLDQARKIVRRLSRQTGASTDLELFSFGEELSPVTMADLEKAVPAGRSTDLEGAMEAAAARETGARILVLTDGRGADPGAGPPAAGKYVLVGIGSRDPFRDIRVAEMRMSDMAFQGKPVEVTALIRGEGYEERDLPVSLKVEGKLVNVQEISLPRGGEKEVKFSWTPEKTGSFRVSVEAKRFPDDNVPDNNYRETSVKVARDRVRVLFISGTPSWNYRFLREALKKDPTIDLISFIILRSPSDVVEVPQNELALIPFPTQKLFTEELAGFDLVIFDNFYYRPYFPPEYLDNLKGMVREGGAFWIWGGPLSFINGGYRGTAVEEMLPFGLDGPPSGEGYLQQSFRLQFTREALASPLFGPEIGPVRAAGASRPDLPALSGFNIVGPAREGAVVLAEHPTYKVGGLPEPIIAMRFYGKGRVMAVATDSLWTWDFIAAGEGFGNKVYLEFVKNAVRWLTQDPFLSPVRITVSPDSASAGETVSVRVRVLDDRYHPVKDASLDISTVTPEGQRINLRAVPTGEEGIYEAQFRLPEAGGYRFTVEAAGRGGKLGEAQALLSASGYQDELASPSLDEKSLRKAASTPGSSYLTFRDDDEFYESLSRALKPEGENMRLLSEERTGLGSLPLTFALAVILLGADWSVRKRYRLE